jgi:copper chaperone NosL
MSKFSRLLLASASVLLLAALALPLWRISLIAPQYPEGLGMEIRARTVVGATEHDLGNINGLNHYIGMKAIEPASIPELRIIPWVIGGLAVTGFLIAAIGKRGPAFAWLGAFVMLGVAGMWDFYHWEWDYGHDINPRAAISIPGMTYQPPLIGSKQLLNITASSWPGLGSYCVFLAFAFAAVAVFRRQRKSQSLGAAA